MESAAAAAKSFSIKSSRLFALAQQLRAYKPPLSSSLDEAEESTGKLISHVGSPVKKAAVLICLLKGDGCELRVILTKRSSTLSTHSGEVSLPGGKAEQHDKDDGITATREAEEEIGLALRLLMILRTISVSVSA